MFDRIQTKQYINSNIYFGIMIAPELSEHAYVVPFICDIEKEQRKSIVSEIFPFVKNKWLEEFKDGWFQNEDDLFPEYFVKFNDGKTTVNINKKSCDKQNLCDFTLHPDVFDNIHSNVDSKIDEMNAGTLKSFKKQKIIINSIDNNDIKEFNQSFDDNSISKRCMTCIIELPNKRIAPKGCMIPSHPLSTLWCGRGVKLDNKYYGQSTECRMFIFDNEQSSFSISPVDSGCQILIIFDIIVDTTYEGPLPSPVTNDRMDVFIEEIIKPLGIKRIGWFSKQFYIGDKIVKNFDARLVNLLKKLAKSIEIITLARINEYRPWYTHKVIESKTCCYSMFDIGVCDGPPKMVDINSTSTNINKYTLPNKRNSIYSKNNCLGDIFVIDTFAQCRHIQTANTETHYDAGDVFTCEFILVNLA